jgi:glycosyltransferase involved in cell wall biosynthesis
MFEPGSIADLARAISRLHQDSALRKRLAEGASDALRSLNWERQRTEYLRAIDSLFEEDFALNRSESPTKVEAGES